MATGKNDHTFHNPQSTLRAELEQDTADLERGCRAQWGVSAVSFRTAKYLFYTATLVLTLYLIDTAEVEPMIAMAFAALLISGPEAIEAWLIKAGELDSRDNHSSNQQSQQQQQSQQDE